MRGSKALNVWRETEGLLAWRYKESSYSVRRVNSTTLTRKRVQCRQQLNSTITMSYRAFAKYERRAQAYEEDKAYDRAVSMYEQLLMYAHKKALGIAERDRCVGAIMRCTAASSSALLF